MWKLELNDKPLTFLYGLQMIVFKLCIFSLLTTLFKMKKIEIVINAGSEVEIIQ